MLISNQIWMDSQNLNGYEYSSSGYTFVDNWLLYSDRLSTKAKLLYLHILNRYSYFVHLAKKKGREIDLERVYYESQKSMLSALGYARSSHKSLTGQMNELKETGLIRMIPRKDGGNSFYYVPLTPDGEINIKATGKSREEASKHRLGDEGLCVSRLPFSGGGDDYDPNCPF